MPNKAVWNRYCKLTAVDDLRQQPLTKPQNAGKHLWPPLGAAEGAARSRSHGWQGGSMEASPLCHIPADNSS